MDTTSASNVVPGYDALDSIDICIRNLKLLQDIILLREETPMDEKQQKVVMDQIKLLEEVSKNAYQSMKDADPVVPMLVVSPAETKESSEQFKSELSMNESETKEPRYLYLGDGLVICCLKLEQSYGNLDKIPSLPKIATLNLMDEGFPIASCLFKLGSDAYLIGGQDLPPCHPETPNFPCEHSKPCGSELYAYIILEHEVRGTSCFTYRLSLAEAGLIVPIKEDILALNDPKIWSVIEKTDDGRLHVINSNPPMYTRCTDATPS